jgi:hypothetical protein
VPFDVILGFLENELEALDIIWSPIVRCSGCKGHAGRFFPLFCFASRDTKRQCAAPDVNRTAKFFHLPARCIVRIRLAFSGTLSYGKRQQRGSQTLRFDSEAMRACRRRDVRRGFLCCGLLLGSCLAAGPARLVELHDLLGSAVDVGSQTFDFRTAAPVVVVAVVTSNEPEGSPTEARRFPGVFLQLRRVRCRLENTLRGDGPRDEFSFYYFADAKLPGAIPNPVHRLLFEAMPGRRYLLFLCREQDVFRSVGDVGDYTIPVFSGAHPLYKPPDDGPYSTGLCRAIADILLTPGEGFDPNKFAQNIAYARLTSDQLGSRLYTVNLLLRILVQREPLRSAACFELAHSYYGHYSCLAELNADPTLAPGVRKHAADVLEEQLESDRALKQALHDPATLDFGKLLRPDSRQAILEELQLILADPDPEVRALACGALRRYFPYDQVHGCSGKDR